VFAADKRASASHLADEDGKRPLVVHLDGALVRSDIVLETGLGEVSRRPRALGELLSASFRGRAALRVRITEAADIDASTLPYDEAVLALVDAAVEAGRPVYLVSAGTRRLVEAVAAHLGQFAGWFASDNVQELTGPARAQRLVETFGQRGFDYVGQDAADLDAWHEAARAYAVRAPRSVERRLMATHRDAAVLPSARAGWQDWKRLLRAGEYPKNLVILLPLVLAQQFDAQAIGAALLALVAFCVAGSGAVVMADLARLCDRRRCAMHADPLASGRIRLLHALAAAPVLLAIALTIALMVSPALLALLALHVAVTTSDILRPKPGMLAGAVVFGAMYAARILAGSVATDIWVPFGLLALFGILFVSLDLARRHGRSGFSLAQARPDAADPDEPGLSAR
jgi:phosphoserine phosphatase